MGPRQYLRVAPLSVPLRIEGWGRKGRWSTHKRVPCRALNQCRNRVKIAGIRQGTQFPIRVELRVEFMTFEDSLRAPCYSLSRARNAKSPSDYARQIREQISPERGHRSRGQGTWELSLAAGIYFSGGIAVDEFRLARLFAGVMPSGYPSGK